MFLFILLNCDLGFSQKTQWRFNAGEYRSYLTYTCKGSDTTYIEVDSMTQDTTRYICKDGVLISKLIDKKESRNKWFRNISVENGFVKEIEFDSLYRVVHTKMQGNYLLNEIYFNPESGCPVFYRGYSNNVTVLEYYDGCGVTVISYRFDLETRKSCVYESSTGLNGVTFKTKFKSIKYFDGWNNLDINNGEIRFWAEMGLYEVGPRYEFEEDYTTKKKSLSCIYYYEEGKAVKCVRYKDGKVISSEPLSP